MIRPIREEKKSSKTWRKYVLIGTSLLEAAVHLYTRMRKRHEDDVRDERRVRFLKRTIMVLLSGLAILLLIIGTLHVLIRLQAISIDGMVSAVSTTLPSDQNGFTNLLLLGEGDSDHDGIDLTDTLMVVSLDPTQTKSAVMLSLPRDLYLLSTEKMGKGRINSLYRDYKNTLIHRGTPKNEASTEALKQLGSEIGTSIGVPIHGTIKLNFSGFEEAIDALGGIDMDVPEDIVDPEYPGPQYTYETFTISKGVQHLDGATALKYARSRHSTSDFSRSGRQQQIIAAASEKAKKIGLLTNMTKATRVMSIIARNMETTFTTRELLGLAKIGKSIDAHKVLSLQLSDANGLYDGINERGGFLYAPPREQFEGASVLLPVSIPEFPVTWKQIQTLTRVLTQHREAFLRPPSILVLNAGAKEGSARLLGAELIRYGFRVIRTSNFSKDPHATVDQSWIAMNPRISLEKGKNFDALQTAPTVELLANILRISRTKTPDITAFSKGEGALAIVLGTDFVYTPLQDLIR